MVDRSTTPQDAVQDFLSSPEVLIAEAKNGRMFILVDDGGVENEGDLIIPGQMATPNAINFMATHGRGLICLALTSERVSTLGLEMMSGENRSRNRTAFTVSIEAKEGVSTGISAADRARTVAVAIDQSNGPQAIVTPGHVFPIAARPGGVLSRAGHTEAAVDIARLAGLNASGVICQIMNDDGTMAKREDLVAFARRHGLKIGAIRDLIAYRRKFDNNIERITEFAVDSKFGGDWKAIVYRNRAVGNETMALVKGEIRSDQVTLVRMHQFSMIADALGENSSRSKVLENAMLAIAEEGAGILVVINRLLPDYMSRMIRFRDGQETSEDVMELRDYGVGAQILADLGVHEMRLLTNTRQTPIALEGYGLNIIGFQNFPLVGPETPEEIDTRLCA